MDEAVRDQFDPATLYRNHACALREWVEQMWRYIQEMNAGRKPGLDGFSIAEQGLRKICQEHGFDLIRNAVTSDEDKIYTLDVPFANGFKQLVEMTTDMVDLIETEIDLTDMLEHLDQCKMEELFDKPSSWARQAAHHLSSSGTSRKLRAFEPSAIAILNDRHFGWESDHEILRRIETGWMRIPMGRREVNIVTDAGVASLNIRDHDQKWFWGEGILDLPHDTISQSVLVGSVGRPISAICDIPGSGDLVVTEAGIEGKRARFKTDALFLEKLKIIETEVSDDQA